MRRHARTNRPTTWALASVAVAMLAGATVDAVLYACARRGAFGVRVGARSVTVDGVRGFVLEADADAERAPAVVVLASQLVRARSYLRLLRELGNAGRRALVVELPGSGRAARLHRPWTSAAYAAWVSGLLTALALEDVTLVGHSNSGAVAARVATADSRVARLVLADTIGARAKRGVARVVAARTIDGFREPLLDLRCWWHIVSNMLAHPRTFWSFVHMASHEDILDVCARVKVPTIISWGRRDGTMPVDGVARLAARMPHAVVDVGHGSHDRIVTRRREFARALLARS